MPLHRLGLSKFLAHTFINASGSDLSLLNVVKLLQDFPGAGQLMCVRPRSNEVPDNKCLQSTALQLIASGMVELRLSHDAPNAICCLIIREVDSLPTCLDSRCWKVFLLV